MKVFTRTQKREFRAYLFAVLLFFLTSFCMVLIALRIEDALLLQIALGVELLAYFAGGILLAICYQITRWSIFAGLIIIPVIALEHYFLPHSTNPIMNYLVPVIIALFVFYLAFIIKISGDKEDEKENSLANNNNALPSNDQ